ncbi:tryptophanyl-tRNA synthetase [Coccidioides immitis RS]|uniref:Tryptophan--tRNA ligase, mitochondrial n=4 Tax=Coccidioides immitis TaxID=5501 RepID=A0A0D8JSM5_COCIM|nr:tryptophanyl-tRNA synthetase [Coccidioides immitis RS]KMP10157.1 tryptophanyl-tRNA synthetase [Coccidioides immitis RMSCC 2394]KMU80775.1 tryptophanyl-tRNA synthetase [Coccidioides immitis RMSCC 3703]KMU86670.1 tryptophanyl-tRNA synthetase [Coccidioides immitis H538.4]TPX24795.1 Tryptophan--tRNA ligase, mitochondrial [Coccidioides immitis]KJF59986.1 tryptophanyl-tRNA synthetase [Coccidioides immitis RS]
MSIPAHYLRARTGLTKSSIIRAANYTRTRHQWHQRSQMSTTTIAPTDPRRIIFSGIQPTGIPHLGNYLGALREWVKLQDDATPGEELIYSIVDLHALTMPQDPEVLREWRRQSFAILLAVGLKPERAMIFFQSAVPAHAELMWILSTVSSMGYLSRMTQWKSKLQLPENSTLEDSSARAKLRLGLFSYPVLQAADILVHSATHVPVGEDQKQHLEFSREVANSFNHIYGPVLTPPNTLVSPAKRIMSLKSPDQKMSKSHADPNSRILLTDEPETIHKKIKVALTDSEPGVTYDPKRRPGVSNLLDILSNFDTNCNLSPTELAKEHESSSLRILKEHVAKKVADHLAPIRERYAELMTNAVGRKYLDKVAEEGARKAASNADKTMKRVKDAIGF